MKWFMIMKISEQFFLEYHIFLQKASHNIARAHKLLILDFRQISCGINKCIDSILIAWVKNNEQVACYQGILHKLLKINWHWLFWDWELMELMPSVPLRKALRIEPRKFHLRQGFKDWMLICCIASFIC